MGKANVCKPLMGIAIWLHFGEADEAQNLRKNGHDTPKRFACTGRAMMKRNSTDHRRRNRVRIALIGIGVVLGISISSPVGDTPAYQFVRISRGLPVTSLSPDRNGEASQAPSGTSLVSAPELERAVTRAAEQHGLHPALLFAVMKAESSFNPVVVSKAGAVGLMQLVPETAMRHGVRNLYDTGENVAGGARHLRYLLDRFHGNTRLALAAYNAGEGKVDRYKKIPPYRETRHYVQKVLSYYRDYRKVMWTIPQTERPHEAYAVRSL